jgi:hypothetical protein
MKKYTTIIIWIVCLSLAYYFYTLATAPKPKGTPQCCDINFTNYNADCVNNTDCICDQTLCANSGARMKDNNYN